MPDKVGAAEVLKAAVERDPFSLDPDEMVEYLRGACRAALQLLGTPVTDEAWDAEYPSHADQIARANDAWDGTGLRSGW